MTSKSLYWAKWKENIKRRGWTLVLCFAALFLFFPVVNMIALNGGQARLEEARQFGASAQVLENYFISMQYTLANSVGFSDIFTVCMAAFAVVFAVQGFSFLYDRRKMDLYMSVPVSAAKRFIMLWANGILMFGVCYLPNLILTWGIGAAFGVMDSELLAGSVLAFFVNMLAFAAMYQLALLAVILTGNVLTALLGSIILFVYEWIVRILFGELKSHFFISYCRADQQRLEALPWFTPFCGYLNLTERITYQGSAIRGYNSYEIYEAYVEASWCSALLKEVFLLLLAVAVIGTLVYLLFRKRKTESYNHSIAFDGIKGILEVLLLVPFSLAAAVFVSNMASDDNFFLLLGALVGILIGHGIIRLIYERDLRALLKGRGAFFVSLTATALVLVVLRFDVLGFDSYLPQKEKVESVSVSLESDYSNFGWKSLEGDASPGTAVMRLLGRMNSTDTATIEAVLRMAEIWQEAGQPAGAQSVYRTGLTVDEEADSTAQPWEDSCWFVVRYQLTDGRSVYRRFLVDGSLCREELNAVLSDASYQKLRYQIYTEAFEKAVESMKIVYYDGKQELLYTTDKQELLTAFRNDFEDYDFDLISAELPCGMLMFAMPGNESYRGYDWGYPVYESFEETIAVLAKNDIVAGSQNGILDASEVKEITVSYYVYSDAYLQNTVIFEPDEVPEQTIVCVFDDPEEIAQILKGVYTYGLENVAGTEFKTVAQGAPYFNVSVSLTAEAMKKQYAVSNLFFLEDGVPEFVIKRIRDAAVRG